MKECKTKIVGKEYKNYLVSWQTYDGTDFCKIFRIEQTANRPNNPDDDEIIMDYMERNYGSSIKGLSIDNPDGIITIDEDYSVEI